MDDKYNSDTKHASESQLTAHIEQRHSPQQPLVTVNPFSSSASVGSYPRELQYRAPSSREQPLRSTNAGTTGATSQLPDGDYFIEKSQFATDLLTNNAEQTTPSGMPPAFSGQQSQPSRTFNHSHRPSLVSGIFKLMALSQHHQHSLTQANGQPHNSEDSAQQKPQSPQLPIPHKLRALHHYNSSMTSLMSQNKPIPASDNAANAEPIAASPAINRSNSSSSRVTRASSQAQALKGETKVSGMARRESVFRESPAFDSNTGSLAAAALQRTRVISATFSSSSREGRHAHPNSRSPSKSYFGALSRKSSIVRPGARHPRLASDKATLGKRNVAEPLESGNKGSTTEIQAQEAKVQQGVRATVGPLETREDPAIPETRVNPFSYPPGNRSEKTPSTSADDLALGDECKLYVGDDDSIARMRNYGSLYDLQTAIQLDVQETLNRQDFLVRLCKAFWMFGSPSYRLVSYMNACSQALDVEASFACFPAMLIISFGDLETHTSETHIIKCAQGYDLDRLQDIAVLAVKVCNDYFRANALRSGSTTTLNEVNLNKKLLSVNIGKADTGEAPISVLEAMDTLHDIAHRPSCYSQRTQIIQLILTGVFLSLNGYGGYWQAMLIAFGEGCIVASLVYLTSRMEQYTNLLEISASVIIGFLAQVLSYHIHGVCFWTVALSGIVNLLPGLGIVLSVTELAARNMVIGTTRLFYSLIVCGMLGFGIMIGSRIAWWVPQSNATATNVCLALPSYGQWLFYPAVCICFAISLKTRPKHLIPALVVGILSYTVWKLASVYIGDSGLATAMSAFSIGLLAHLYTKLSNTIALAVALPALIYLLPGSLALRGFAAILIDGSANALTLSLSVLETAISITAGLFVANMIVMPMSDPAHISI